MPRLMKTYKNMTFRVKMLRGDMWEVKDVILRNTGEGVPGFDGERICDTMILEMLKRGAMIYRA